MFVTFARRSVSIQGNYAHTNIYIQRLDCTHVHTGAVPKNSSARSQCGNIPKATPAKNSNANSVTQIKVLPPSYLRQHEKGAHGTGWRARCGHLCQWPHIRRAHQSKCKKCQAIKDKAMNKPDNPKPFTAQKLTHLKDTST